MVVEPSCDADKVTQFIMQYIDDVQLARRHGNELSYTLPLSEVNSFPGRCLTLGILQSENLRPRWHGQVWCARGELWNYIVILKYEQPIQDNWVTHYLLVSVWKTLQLCTKEY